ncbi:MAG: Dabb family protein [Chthoniobacterales bacterium]
MRPFEVGCAATMQSIFPLARPLHPRDLSVRDPSLSSVFFPHATLLAPTISVPAVTNGEIKHVVVFWLKRPGNANERAPGARASESFRRLPGITHAEGGRGLPARRPGIEQSFDLCAIFTFRNRAELERFDASPDRRRAVETVLKPLVQRYTVSNSALE